MFRRPVVHVSIAMLAIASASVAAERRDPHCKTVVSKEERAARLQGRDPRALDRDEYPSDPVALYKKAKEIGNLRAAWGAIIRAHWQDYRKADALWRDYWCSEVLAAFEDRPLAAFGMLKAAAERGLPSAMRRLSAVYARGEFEQPRDPQLAGEWKRKYQALKLR